MLRHVNKITDTDRSMFFTNIKCNLDLNFSTTTTHGDCTKTTKTKGLKK